MGLLRESKLARDCETTRLFFLFFLAYVRKKQYLCRRKGIKQV